MVLATLVLTAVVMDKLGIDRTWKNTLVDDRSSVKAFESVLYVGLVFLLFSWANTLYGTFAPFALSTHAKYRKWQTTSVVFEVLNLLLLGVLVYQYSRLPNFQPTNTYWAYVGCTGLSVGVVAWICRLEWKRVTRSKTVMQNLQQAFDAAVVAVRPP